MTGRVALCAAAVRLAALAWLVATAAPCIASAQDSSTVRARSPRATVRDAGPGRSGRWLRTALAGPHHLVRSDSANPVTLKRDTVYTTTVLVVGGPATVASTVRGDVIVVGGDLFLHPGVDISGRAIAIGGGVYRTTLGVVRGGRFPFQDHTFAITALADGTLALDYLPLGDRDTRVVVFPGLYGIRIPSYDRTNGLSVPFGPTLRFDTARYEIEALAVYRSQLGEVDPGLELRGMIGRRLTVDVKAGRTTASNDRWIYSDFVNSITTFIAGSDTRNYYRADRADARLSYLWETDRATFRLIAGGLGERGSSARPDSGALGGPWSIFGRRDVERMLRPNPRIVRGRIASALGGGAMTWEEPMLTARWSALTEVPFVSPGDGRYVQTTLDGEVKFPTFSTQRLEIETHAVVTTGDVAPPQRFAYLGGSGTLPTFDLLEFGGDQLIFVEGRYFIPIDRVRIKVLGSPTLVLRYMTGAAGIGELPSLEQNVGVRVQISLLRVDYIVDPASSRTKFSAGLSLFR